MQQLDAQSGRVSFSRESYAILSKQVLEICHGEGQELNYLALDVHEVSELPCLHQQRHKLLSATALHNSNALEGVDVNCNHPHFRSNATQRDGLSHAFVALEQKALSREARAPLGQTRLL